MVKVISLSNEAYEKLKALKFERSFSEAITDLIENKKKEKRNIMDFCGIWADRKEEVDKMKKMIERDRKKFKLREVKF
ncbi:antitoxin [Candidatus Pacearchaeota archaeon]|nr:antitoxin [Candidatus Pacearchaeota archaeon]